MYSSTPLATSSTSSGFVFGNTTPPNNFAFGNSGTTSGSLLSLSTSTTFQFGLSTTLKDSNSSASSSTMFSFGAQTTPAFGSSDSPLVFSFGASPQTQPMFGSNTVIPAFGSVPGGSNGMSEDSMAEDMAGPSPAPTPSVPVFGQSPPLNSSPKPFMFGSTPQTPPNGVVPFQFGGQPSQLGGQVANPLQQNGNGLNFGGGDGSFSLGSSGGGDKSSRRTVRVKKKTQRR